MARAFCIHANDNVATLLDDVETDAIELIGAQTGSLIAHEPIKLGHKVAVCDIAPGGDITKYGLPIGHATHAIQRGQWVHLHNCASNFDERSATLDVQSGAPTDTRYE